MPSIRHISILHRICHVLIVIIIVVIVLDAHDSVAAAGLCAVEVDLEFALELAQAVTERLADSGVGEGVEDLELAGGACGGEGKGVVGAELARKDLADAEVSAEDEVDGARRRGGGRGVRVG